MTASTSWLFMSTPVGMAWLPEGFGYAAVNYRGSVTFGRRFREGFWGAPGEAELRRSPLTYVRNVRAPLLMSQATSDTRTPAQVSEYVRRLREAGGDGLLTWFDGGHETTSTTSLVHDQELVMELAPRAMRGERWDEYEPR
jgi:dipeptidyl aminopeptidase/acylaminoacyl peptidase